MKILIGYDGLECSDRIFDDLTRAGLTRESEALVVSVADLLAENLAISEFDLHSAASRRVEAVLARAQAHRTGVIRETEDLAARAAERLRSQFPDWKVESAVKTGTPWWELIDAANAWNADLLVVGSNGRSAIGRLFLGSVSKKVAADARCSVRVARGNQPKQKDEPALIIIGVDGSPASEEAIYAVGHRVWQDESEALLVAVDDAASPNRVVARLPQAAAMIDSYFQTRETRVSSMLDWATAELNAIGLKTTVLKEKGDPQKVLLKIAAERAADSIFVGTRDFSSAFERFRLGSVSTAVATNAHCSVEIVRPPSNEQYSLKTI